jgi:hypothetical protein
MIGTIGFPMHRATPIKEHEFEFTDKGKSRIPRGSPPGGIPPYGKIDVKPDFLAQNLVGSYGYFSLLSLLGNSMTVPPGP